MELLTRLSSQYGSQIIIEYSDGISNQDYYCVTHGKDELAVVVADYSYLDNVSQIYIDGLKLIEEETNVKKIIMMKRGRDNEKNVILFCSGMYFIFRNCFCKKCRCKKCN